ncbi:MAG: hypothetical protein ACK4GJ_01945 [bacterium]
MEKNKVDKIIDTFKNNKDIVAIYSLADKVPNIYGKIEESTFLKVKNIIDEFKKNLSTDYISFNLSNYMIIYFKHDEDDIVIFGTSNLKEPLVRISIKSLK